MDFRDPVPLGVLGLEEEFLIFGLDEVRFSDDCFLTLSGDKLPSCLDSLFLDVLLIDFLESGELGPSRLFSFALPFLLVVD